MRCGTLRGWNRAFQEPGAYVKSPNKNEEIAASRAFRHRAAPPTRPPARNFHCQLVLAQLAQPSLPSKSGGVCRKAPQRRQRDPRHPRRRKLGPPPPRCRGRVPGCPGPGLHPGHGQQLQLKVRKRNFIVSCLGSLYFGKLLYKPQTQLW